MFEPTVSVHFIFLRTGVENKIWKALFQNC